MPPGAFYRMRCSLNNDHKMHIILPLYTPQQNRSHNPSFDGSRTAPAVTLQHMLQQQKRPHFAHNFVLLHTSAKVFPQPHLWGTKLPPGALYSICCSIKNEHILHIILSSFSVAWKTYSRLRSDFFHVFFFEIMIGSKKKCGGGVVVVFCKGQLFH